MNHKWGPKMPFPLANKSERTCERPGCGVTKVRRHEHEGGKPVHWQEFWRDGERIECEGTPPCTGRAKTVTYQLPSYPL